MSEQVSVTITRQDKYRFLVDFGPGMPTSVADEPAPLGDGEGPSPSHLLAAAVANCLAASLLFAHGKFKEDPGRLTATAACRFGRNDKNRLRVVGIDVTIGAIVREVLNLKLQWGGYGVLLAQDGTVIALPSAGERDWGLRVSFRIAV